MANRTVYGLLTNAYSDYNADYRVEQIYWRREDAESALREIYRETIARVEHDIISPDTGPSSPWALDEAERRLAKLRRVFAAIGTSAAGHDGDDYCGRIEEFDLVLPDGPID